LLDDCEQTYRANVELFKHYGKEPPSYGDYRAEISFPISEYYRKKGIHAPFEEIKNVFYSSLTDHGETNMFPHAGELLHLLKHRGIKTALLTLQHPAKLTEQLELYGLTGFFDEIHAGVYDKREEIHELLAKFHFRPDEIVYFGDTAHDIEAGKSAGVKAAAVTYGYGPRESLERTGPDYIFGSLGEAVELFE